MDTSASKPIIYIDLTLSTGSHKGSPNARNHCSFHSIGYRTKKLLLHSAKISTKLQTKYGPIIYHIPVYALRTLCARRRASARWRRAGVHAAAAHRIRSMALVRGHFFPMGFLLFLCVLVLVTTSFLPEETISISLRDNYFDTSANISKWVSCHRS